MHRRRRFTVIHITMPEDPATVVHTITGGLRTGGLRTGGIPTGVIPTSAITGGTMTIIGATVTTTVNVTGGK